MASIRRGGIERTGSHGARGARIAVGMKDDESFENELVATERASESSAGLTGLKQHANKPGGEVIEVGDREARLKDGEEEAATELGGGAAGRVVVGESGRN